MSLPIVIIFERHWDTIPKLATLDLLPSLANYGYDTYCLEIPENVSQDEIIAGHASGLKEDIDVQIGAENLLKQKGIIKNLGTESFNSLAELMRLHVSSKQYFECAEKIKQLEASKILKDIFKQATQLSFLIKGIDIKSGDFDEMISPDITARGKGLTTNEEYRISTFFKNLVDLHRERDGVVFVCGARHAEKLLRKFKEKGMENRVVYFFPYSKERYFHHIDDVREISLAKNPALHKHSSLLSQDRIKPFTQEVMTSIKNGATYQQEIFGGNSHSQYLSQHFKVDFKAFLRRGNYVDALVSTKVSNIEDIRKELDHLDIESHDTTIDKEGYLVIPSINTRPVSSKIRQL